MRSAVSFVVWAALAAAPPAAAERLLTEEESVRLALARAEKVQLQRGLVGAAEADAVEAGLWPNPTLVLEWSARQARIELDQISGGTTP